jgi:hypothetical protein
MVRSGGEPGLSVDEATVAALTARCRAHPSAAITPMAAAGTSGTASVRIAPVGSNCFRLPPRGAR